MSDEKKPPGSPTFDSKAHVQNVRCSGTTKQGAACPWSALKGGTLCQHHEPTKAAENRARARQLGVASGKARRNKPTGKGGAVSLDSAVAIREFLEFFAAELKTSGEGKSKKANAAARIASVLMGAYRTEELEERLAALERKASQ